MIDYLKDFDRTKLIEKAKPLGIAAVCFVAVFVSGYGIGKSSGTNNSAGQGAAKRSLNYTTQNAGGQNDNKGAAKPTTTTMPTGDCYIKGSKSKTYHLPGGAFYDKTTPAACFNSEEEAIAAGYKKSSR